MRLHLPSRSLSSCREVPQLRVFCTPYRAARAVLGSSYGADRYRLKIKLRWPSHLRRFHDKTLRSFLDSKNGKRPEGQITSRRWHTYGPLAHFPSGFLTTDLGIEKVPDRRAPHRNFSNY
ncbi:hypothetical protein HZH68_001386 [Vespula germanica]|uniref:Uncharacterized protein n=1 Tax=Vespula germanica TaxID=30212 RepID=A0A834NVC3_VESGE|nr:hypothetical protein HZH68_001386 [Vespula germanica]